MGVVPPAPPQGLLTEYARSLIRIKARQLARRVEFRADDRQDLEQELTLRLLAKAARYDPARGASADTFANRVIRTEVRVLLRDRRRLKRVAGGGGEVRSLAETTTAPDGVPVVLGEVVVPADLARRTGGLADDDVGARAEVADAVAEAVRGLPPDLRRLAERLRHGTVADVAREMGVSRQRVYVSLRLIRERFAAAGLAET